VPPQLEEDDLVASLTQPLRDVQDLIVVGGIAVAEEQSGARERGLKQPDVKRCPINGRQHMGRIGGERVGWTEETPLRVEDLSS
jgi:hypothetical protein